MAPDGRGAGARSAQTAYDALMRLDWDCEVESFVARGAISPDTVVYAFFMERNTFTVLRGLTSQFDAIVGAIARRGDDVR